MCLQFQEHHNAYYTTTALVAWFAPWPFSAEHTRLQYDESLPPAIWVRYSEQFCCHTRTVIFQAFISVSAGVRFYPLVAQFAASHGHIIHNFAKNAPHGINSLSFSSFSGPSQSPMRRASWITSLFYTVWCWRFGDAWRNTRRWDK